MVHRDGLTRWSWSAVLAAFWIAIGLALRLAVLDTVEFKGDERAALELGIGLLEERPWSSDAPWPRHGILSSQRIANAPLLTWIVAAAWWIAPHPLAPTAFIAIINAAALGLLWRWARRQLDDSRAGLLLAIAAVSPFTVLYSRKLWGQNLLFPSLLCVLWAVVFARDGRWWRAAILLLAAALLVGQLHQSGPIALAVLPIAWSLQAWRDRRRGHPAHRWKRPTALEGVALAAVLALNAFFWVPYFVYLVQAPLWRLAARSTLTTYWPALLENLYRQVAPHDLFFSFGDDRADFLAGSARRVAYSASVALGAPLFALGVWHWIRSPFRVPVIGVWWWLIIAAFALARIPTYPFYVLILSPLPACIAVGAFEPQLPPAWLARLLRMWRWAYVVSLLVLTVLTGAWLARRGGSAGDYGVIYRLRAAQARAVAGENRVVDVPDVHRADGLAVPSFECAPPPPEVMWLARWVRGTGWTPADPPQLCEAWVDSSDGRVYVWKLQH